MMNQHGVETANAWVLSEGSGYRRESIRPMNRRPGNFAALFDALTVVYDCFRVAPTRALLITPPLNRFAGILDSLVIRSQPDGIESRYRFEHHFTTVLPNRRIDNLCRIWVDIPERADSLHLQCKAGETTLDILPNAGEIFRGRRVLLTLSKDNDPAWICDWMRFHRDLQHADAALLYDNGSTAYTAECLLEKMRRVPGFRAVHVVEWPYKYGPQGIGRGTWDSAFCQNGAMEDARWRFLGDAQAVLNCDIDELALSDQGNLFEKAAASTNGYVRFSGRWVNGPRNELSLLRHKQSTKQLLPKWSWKGFRLKDINLCPTKWAAVPSRCSEDALWTTHEIVGMRPQDLKPAQTCYRHFLKITTNWKTNRRDMESSGLAGHKQDTKLQQAFAKVQWDE
jgi:hypothetical protein